MIKITKEVFAIILHTKYIYVDIKPAQEISLLALKIKDKYLYYIKMFVYIRVLQN